ncbi:MAG: ACP S-malonyltransferase [Firmicutes bacterium]|nr:ACP S-malonyltransferase [Bacillota bacterium]
MSKTALLFSGQGAQFSGMGKDYYKHSSQARQLFDELSQYRDDITSLCFESSSQNLNFTINAQPALFATGLAGAFAWTEQNGKKPDCIAGFSLGEIPALVFCGALSVYDGWRLVCKRAELMQLCAENTNGGMAAVVGLSVDKVIDLVAIVNQHSNDLWCANYNSFMQTVVAGDLNAIDKLSNKVSSSGGRLIKLRVSGAFHCPYMEQAQIGLANFLETLQFNHIDIPLYSNIDGNLYTDKDIKSRVALQLTSPVRWINIIQNMQDYGVEQFVEVGAGNVLTGLVNKIVNCN